MPTKRFFSLLTGMILVSALLLLSACGRDNLPSVSDLPQQLQDLPAQLPQLPKELDSLPAIPDALRQLPGMLEELGLPDLSGIANLPDIDDLPILNSEPGSMVFNGPSERRLAVGDRLPGSNIELVAVADGNAEFRIDGLRSIRTTGDSLDFDGPWPGAPDITYNVRLRIYHVGNDSIRAAGVHQLTIPNVMPTPGDVTLGANTFRFPFTTSAGRGESFPGTTYGFVAAGEPGAEISGLPAGDYPYVKMGDSLRWRGSLRPDIPAEYNLRMVTYNESNARIGGIVNLSLP